MATKIELKSAILHHINRLSKIPTSFKKHDDTLLYKSTDDKLKIFLSMIDTIDPQYYDKLQTQLDEIKDIIDTLSKALKD